MRTLSRRVFIGGTLSAVATPAAFADDYPNRNVTFVVPFTPAGGTDLLARLLGQKLSDKWGKSFIIENKPGAGTVLAANYVAKSPPDGYTIMMEVSSLAINATLYKKLPYDPVKDLRLISLTASVPFVLVVDPSLPVKTVADLIKLAKEKPLSYGSGGVGAFHHLCAELFSSETGIKMTHVPYKGTAPAINDLIGGYIQVMFSDLGPALPQIQAGKIRALGITSKQRFIAAPDLQPLAEVGLPDFDAAAWQGVIAPSQTPNDIVAKLNTELNAVVQTDDVRKKLADLGMNPIGKGSPDELDKFLLSEIGRWGKVVESAGIAHSV